MNSNLDKNYKDEIYKLIATQLLQEVMNEDLSTIVNRDRIFEIFKKISTQGQDKKNYLLVHTRLQNNLVSDQSFQNDDFMEILMKNNEKLYNEIYQKIKSEFTFDIVLHKYGRKINRIRERWAYIIYPDIFGSTADPISKIKKKKSGNVSFKNKNFSLEKMLNIEIQKFDKVLKDYKADNRKYPIRISIKFNDVNKDDRETFIYLYFENEQNTKQTYDLLMQMRMKFLIKNNAQILGNLQHIAQSIEPASKFMLMKKIIDVKNQIKEKKPRSKIIADDSEKEKTIDEIKEESSKISKLTLGNKFNNLLIDFIKNTNNNNVSRFKSLGLFKNAKETLTKFFKNKLITKYPDKYLQIIPAAYVQSIEKVQNSNFQSDKKVGFLISKQNMEGIINKSGKPGVNINSQNDLIYTNSFSAKNLTNINEIFVNINKNRLIFGKDPKNFISQEEFCDIHSIYLNLNEKGNYEENSIVINGPKKELSKYFTYKLKVDFLKENFLNIDNQCVEPEYHGLRIEQNFPIKFKPLIIQIFHTSITMPFNYSRILERENSQTLFCNKNFNQNNNENFNLNLDEQKGLALKNPLEDFYFFISLTVNRRFFARTRLTKASCYEADKLTIEFNTQALMNQEQIDLLENFQMKISVNLIPVSCLGNQINDDLELNKGLNKEARKDLNRNNSNNINLGNNLVFSEFKVESFIEHLKPHEIAYCYIDHQSLKSNKNEFLLKNNILDYDPNNNFITMNIISGNELAEKNQITRFVTKDFSIGQEIYYLREYTKEDFDKILNDPDIPEDVKEKYFNVEFDNKGNFLLRPHILDQRQFINNFSKNPTEEDNENIIKILKNAKYQYLPKCELFTDEKNISKSTNLYLNKNYLNSTEVTDTHLIYKLRKFQKYSLCKIIGFGYSKRIIMQDLFLGKAFVVNQLDLLTKQSKYPINNKNSNSDKKDPSSYLEELDFAESFYFKNIQENPISVYDFRDLMEPNQNLLNNFVEKSENNNNNAFNHHWRICLKFKNSLETDAFLFYIKELRRNANFEARDKSFINSPVNTKLLAQYFGNIRNEFKKLNIIIEKIEFKNNLKLTGGKRKLHINLYKGNREAQINTNRNRSLIELLENEGNQNYKNSLLQIPEIKKEVDFFIQSRLDNIQRPAILEIDSESLAKKNHQIDFNKDDSLRNDNNRFFEIDILPSLNKIFSIQALFALNDNSFVSQQDLYNFISEEDLSNVINSNLPADFIRCPLYYASNKTIAGMIDFKFWITQNLSENLSKEMQFNKIFDERFKNPSIIKNLMRDQYGNLCPISKINPNLYKRKIIGIIHKETNKDLDEIPNLVLNETDGSIKNKLLKCLKNKDILGYELLNKGLGQTKNAWKELIPDQNLKRIKTFKKFYINIKKREFYNKLRKEEWRKLLENSRLIRESAFDNSNELNRSQKEAIEKIYEKASLIQSRIDNSAKYMQLRSYVEMGIPEDLRIFVWDTLLNIKTLKSMTIDALKKLNNNSPDVIGLESKQDVFEYFLNNVQQYNDFNINFSFIDNDMNYLYKSDLSEYNLEITSNTFNDNKFEKINEKNANMKRIRNICKAYFLWTNLNIYTSVLENNDKKPKKYIYFFGMLKLIKTFISIFKEDHIVFWILIGLSQVVELFYQSNPLLSNQLNYSKVYIMITKVS